MSSTAIHVYEIIAQGSLFFDEIQDQSSLLPSQLEQALSELVDAGRVSCDSFQALLKLVNKRSDKRKLARKIGSSTPFAGRWSVIKPVNQQVDRKPSENDAVLLHACSILLSRYGVVFYSILEKESGFPRWRQHRYMFKRMEARGEVVAGRFVSKVGGEQFAKKEVITLLRKNNRKHTGPRKKISAIDPVNLFRVFQLGEPIAHKINVNFYFEQGKYLLA